MVQPLTMPDDVRRIELNRHVLVIQDVQLSEIEPYLTVPEIRARSPDRFQRATAQDAQLTLMMAYLLPDDVQDAMILFLAAGSDGRPKTLSYGSVPDGCHFLEWTDNRWRRSHCNPHFEFKPNQRVVVAYVEHPEQ